MPAKPQKRSYQSLEARAFVALLIAADRLTQQAEQLVKEQSLTGTQYNVLRIVRGADPLARPPGKARIDISRTPGQRSPRGKNSHRRRRPGHSEKTRCSGSGI